jgi:hypothetical protein
MYTGNSNDIAHPFQTLATNDNLLSTLSPK